MLIIDPSVTPNVNNEDAKKEMLNIKSNEHKLWKIIADLASLMPLITKLTKTISFIHLNFELKYICVADFFNYIHKA